MRQKREETTFSSRDPTLLARAGSLWIRKDIAASYSHGSSQPNRRVRAHQNASSLHTCHFERCKGCTKSGVSSRSSAPAPRAEGGIHVNGAPMDKAAFKKNSGFVTQNSVFLDALTVRPVPHHPPSPKRPASSSPTRRLLLLAGEGDARLHRAPPPPAPPHLGREAEARRPRPRHGAN